MTQANGIEGPPPNSETQAIFFAVGEAHPGTLLTLYFRHCRTASIVRRFGVPSPLFLFFFFPLSRTHVYAVFPVVQDYFQTSCFRSSARNTRSGRILGTFNRLSPFR